MPHTDFSQFEISRWDFVKGFVAVVSLHVFSASSLAFLHDLLAGLESGHAGWVALVSLTVALVFTFWFGHGHRTWQVWKWVAFGGYILVQWCAVAIERMADSGETGYLVVIVPSAIVLWLLFQRAARPPSNSLHVVETADFAKTDALIVFLSTLSVPNAWRENHGCSDPGGFGMNQKRAYIKDLLQKLPAGAAFGNKLWEPAFDHLNIYMPLVAIQKHAMMYPFAPLRVVVIPSAEGRSKGSAGSAIEVELLREVVKTLSAARSLNVNIKVLDEHVRGVSYEDLTAVSKAVHEAKSWLNEHRSEQQRHNPVVIDITSGQATCSAVGAALSFAVGECIQYVSTNGYAVKQYDLRYEPEMNPVHH